MLSYRIEIVDVLSVIFFILNRCKAALEDGIRQQAVQAVDLDRLRTLAAETVDMDAVSRAQSDALKALNDAKAARNALPSDKETHATLLQYAHCGCENQLVPVAGKMTLTKPGATISKQEIRERCLAIAKADSTISNLEGQYHDATRVLNQANQRAREIEIAKVKLAEIQNQPQGQAVDLNALRTTVSNRELKLKAFQLKTRADVVNHQIEQSLKIVEVLAPDGLRAAKQQEAIAAFVDGYLIPASKASGWGEVRLTGEMIPTYRGRSYSFLSESERLRVDATIQVACALLDESKMVIVDRADTLDRGGFGGLIRLLRWSKIPSVICSTYGDPDRPPKDFEALGIGRTYWMDNGQAVPFSQKVQKAA